MSVENENAPDMPAGGPMGQGRDGQGADGQDAAAGGNDPAARIAALEAELADAKDKLLRALADTENVRRRGEREREQERRFAATNFGKDMLNVADNLRRALDSAPEAQAQDDFTRTLLSGVAATERELLSAFERHGIRRIAPEPGEKFDHNIHQAMFEVEHTGKPAGSIVQVLQNGYLMHDRLLRPALVGVAKADAKPPETPRVDTMA
jgi:molecular chaperone GrpE